MASYTALPTPYSDVPSTTKTRKEVDDVTDVHVRRSPPLIDRLMLTTIIPNIIALCLGMLLAIAVLTPLTPLAISSTARQSIIKQKEEIAKSTSCGTSVEEAKAQGCLYDPSLLAWISPHCKPDDITDHFIRQPIHAVYHDKDLRQPMNMSYYLAGEFSSAYDNVEHHKNHCLNVWKALIEASLLTSKPTQSQVLVPSSSLSWDHTVHCSEGVIVPNMDSPWRTLPKVSFNVEYLACELLQLGGS